MERRNFNRNAIVELKAVIMRQQEQVATLARGGQRAKARRSRDGLIALLYRLDVLETASKPEVDDPAPADA